MITQTVGTIYYTVTDPNGTIHIKYIHDDPELSLRMATRIKQVFTRFDDVVTLSLVGDSVLAECTVTETIERFVEKILQSANYVDSNTGITYEVQFESRSEW